MVRLVKFIYKWPNAFFIIWLIVCGAFIAFFYDAGRDLANLGLHYLLFAYMSYGIMAIWIMLAILPYLLGLTIEFPKARTQKVTEKPIDNKPVGYDYFIPIYGYLKYQFPNLKGKGKWIVLIENVALYFILGLVNGLLGYKLTLLFVFALIIAVIAEYYIYYKAWMPFMKTPSGITKTQRGIAYLAIQEHAFAFMALGWILGILLIR